VGMPRFGAAERCGQDGHRQHHHCPGLHQLISALRVEGTPRRSRRRKRRWSRHGPGPACRHPMARGSQRGEIFASEHLGVELLGEGVFGAEAAQAGQAVMGWLL
jgi:hypothetical protein